MRRAHGTVEVRPRGARLASSRGLRVSTFFLALTALAVPVAGQGFPDLRAQRKISAEQGGLQGPLREFAFFGSGIARLGDLDGDGVGDLAVGAPLDDASLRGAVYVLFLNRDGSVKAQRKIEDASGAFLEAGESFGSSVTSLGDLDGDGVIDLAVGAPDDDDGGMYNGAVWILFLNTDGSVKASQKISETQGGFTGFYYLFEAFGTGLAFLGDLDGDGVGDLAVGARGDRDFAGSFECGNDFVGAVWILFLNTDGTVRAHQKISDSQGGFTGDLEGYDQFGRSVAALGDLDGDGIAELAVGAPGTFCNNLYGSIWVLFLRADGTVRSHVRISAGMGGFGGLLDPFDDFGFSVAALGDLDGNGVPDMAVGAVTDDDGVLLGNAGATWLLLLASDGTVQDQTKISEIHGGFDVDLQDNDYFGSALAWIGDPDGDGVSQLAVGTMGDDDGGNGPGALYVLSFGDRLRRAPRDRPLEGGSIRR